MKVLDNNAPCDATTHQTCASNDCTNYRTHRPFSTDESHARDMLMVLVHFGEGLQSLFPEHDEPPSTFVATSLGSLATSHRVQCEVIATEHRVPAERQYSPFSVTRIVEKSFVPWWNELLVLPQPTGSVQAPATDEKTQTQAAHVSLTLALRLELFERDKSQQEDYLVAVATVPLAGIFSALSSQVRLAVRIPVTGQAESTDSSHAMPCVYVSVWQSPCQTSEPDLARMEVLVEKVDLEGNQVGEHEPINSWNDAISVAVLSSCENEEEGSEGSFSSDLRKAYMIIGHDDQLQEEDCGWRSTGITPSTSLLCSKSTLRVSFPLIMPFKRIDADKKSMRVLLYRNYDLIARGGLEGSLLSALLLSGKGGGVHTEIPLSRRSPDANREDTLLSADATHFRACHIHLRYWEEEEWRQFLSKRADRRVVCTNRKNLRRVSKPEWMGAIIRGLNRFPVASVADEGGVSSVLVTLFAQERDTETARKPPNIQKGRGEESPVMLDLLHQQILSLHKELEIKQKLIDKLQGDVEARGNAIKMCGIDLVALRRQLKQKDDEICTLQGRVRELEQHEEQKMTEILATTGKATFRTDSTAGQRLAILAQKYKELEKKFEESERRADDTSRKLEDFESLQKRFKELEQAHVDQAAQVQRLQREKHRLLGLRNTVRLQEQVIQQFESAVGSQCGPMPSPPPAYSSSHDHGQLPASSSGQDDNALAIRVRILEEQLTRNASTAASEISALKLRILELEAQLPDPR